MPGREHMRPHAPRRLADAILRSAGGFAVAAATKDLTPLAGGFAWCRSFAVPLRGIGAQDDWRAEWREQPPQRIAPCSVVALIVALSVALAMCPAHAARPGGISYGGTYLYHLNVPEDAWQRLLAAPEVTYICSQFSCGAIGEQEARRVREAKAAGKRVVAQLWWGGSGRFNWSYYSLANIAMDPEIRRAFCDNVLDPTLAALGPENLYGAHLLEETGMQFGTDVDEPGDPVDLWDGDDNGSNWDQPALLGAGGVPGYIGGPYILNVRRYAERFTRDTGLDLRGAPLWSGRDFTVYRQWVAVNLQAGAANAFADHLHAKYPGLKAFTWDGPAWDGCGATNLVAMRDHIDGLIMDPYSDAPGNYAAVRAARLLAPSAEIIAVLWGVDDQPAGEMVNRFTSAYLGGADVLAYFGDTSQNGDQTWQERLTQVRPFLRLPAFTHHPRVLLITGHTQDWAGSPSMLTGLISYDVVPALEAPSVPLAPYDLVILFEAEHPGLEAYVRGGGRALYVDAMSAPDFLARAGALTAPPVKATPWAGLDLSFRPAAWWREHLALAEEYPLRLSSRRAWQAVGAEGGGEPCFFLRVGAGAVCFAPLRTTWPFPPPERLSAFRRLLTDLARGLLLEAGKAETARTCLADPAHGSGYLLMQSDDRQVIAGCRFRSGELTLTPLPLPGRDVLSGEETPTLGGTCRTAVIVQAPTDRQSGGK